MSAKQLKPPVCPACLPSRVSYIVHRVGTFYGFCSPDAGGSVEGPHRWEDMEIERAAIAYAKSVYPQHYPEAQPVEPAAAFDGPLTISAPILALLEGLVGQKIRGENDIKSILFDAVHGRDDLEKEVARWRSTAAQMRAAISGRGGAALQPGQYMVTAPEWADVLIVESAASVGKSAQEWVQEEFTRGIEQYNAAPVGAPKR